MQEDVFRFDDFLKGKEDSKLDSKGSRKVFEDLEEDEHQELVGDSESSHIEDDENFLQQQVELIESEEDNTQPEEEIEEEIEGNIQIKESTDNYYKLYSDKTEDFACDISIEGADPNDTQARLVVESNDWTLMFTGEIKNGKCVVPIKKLSILKEGQVGNIRLEVVAEGNLFVPWEDKFKVKLSKKVTVKVNEQKQYSKKPVTKQSTVKVKVKK